MSQTIAPIRASTQVFTEIEDITKDLLLLTDGSCALLIETSAVNFGLLSEKEQEAIIYAYSGLLNSLSFPIQIYIRSTQKDISGYLKQLEIAENKQTNQLLRDKIRGYRSFVASVVKEKNVLDKKFYIIIPFSPLEMGLANPKAFVKSKGLPLSKDTIIERATTVLSPKRDHLLRQLSRIGLKGTQLNNQKLIELFKQIYNPEEEHTPIDLEGTTTPVVNTKPW